jgi:hypothetical protein
MNCLLPIFKSWAYQSPSTVRDFSALGANLMPIRFAKPWVGLITIIGSSWLNLASINFSDQCLKPIFQAAITGSTASDTQISSPWSTNRGSRQQAPTRGGCRKDRSQLGLCFIVDTWPRKRGAGLTRYERFLQEPREGLFPPMPGWWQISSMCFAS